MYIALPQVNLVDHDNHTSSESQICHGQTADTLPSGEPLSYKPPEILSQTIAQGLILKALQSLLYGKDL